MLCNRHLQNIFIIPKGNPVFLKQLLPMPSPFQALVPTNLCSVIMDSPIVDTSYKWTPILHDLLHLASFPSHKVSECPISILKDPSDWAHLDNWESPPYFKVSWLATLIPSTTFLSLCHVTEHTHRLLGLRQASWCVGSVLLFCLPWERARCVEARWSEGSYAKVLGGCSVQKFGPGAPLEGLRWAGEEGEEARKELMVGKVRWARAGVPKL